jgi:hypothetical protein
MARKNHSTLPQEDIEEFRKDNGCTSPCGGEVEVQLSELGLTWRSTLLEKDATRIRRTYRVPSEVAIRIPDDGEPAVPREDGETVVYEEMFKARLQLPLHPFVQELLAKMALSPGQIKPNG